LNTTGNPWPLTVRAVWGAGLSVLLAYVDRVTGEIAISVDQLIKLKEVGTTQPALIARTSAARSSTGMMGSSPGVLTGSLRR
jgi:hypothetical protein